MFATDRRTRRVLARLALLAVPVGLLGFLMQDRPAISQENAAVDPGVTYVGVLKGEGAPESARVAVVVQGDGVRAYVCSGDLAFNGGNSRWFVGKAGADGALQAASPDGRTLTGKAAGNSATVTIKVGDKEYTADAALIELDNPAGLYRREDVGEEETVVNGWIVDASGRTVGSASGQKSKQIALPNKLNDAAKVGVSPFRLDITGLKIGLFNFGGQFNEQALEAKWSVTAAGSKLGLLTPEQRAQIKGIGITWTLEHPETKAPTEVKSFKLTPADRLNRFKTAGTSFADRTQFTAKVTMQFLIPTKGGKSLPATITASKTDFFQIP